MNKLANNNKYKGLFFIEHNQKENTITCFKEK